MSTWNVLTITNETGQEITDIAALETILEEHGWEVDCWDGESLAHVTVWESGPRTSRLVKSSVQASWHSKYSDDTAFQEVSRVLGPDMIVTHSQEWTDDEPGGSVDVWRGGELDPVASQHMTMISDSIMPGDGLLKPVFLTAETIGVCWYNREEPWPEGTRFLVLPPVPEQAS